MTILPERRGWVELRRPDGRRDRRLTPANGRVASVALRGEVVAERFVTPEPRRVRGFSTFLHESPGGRRDRELLGGDRFDVLEERDGWAFGQAEKDGYCGWLRAEVLGADFTPTHVVRLRHTYLYLEPDIKAPPLIRLPFGAAVEGVATLDETQSRLGGWPGKRGASVPVEETQAGRLDRSDRAGRSPLWIEAAEGWVRSDHLRPAGDVMTDPVAVAELFLGTPYLWAGNTGDGIDCSGLVQAACLACGMPCPGDSDLQARALGEPLAPGTPLRRNDLVFWAGHVALVADGARLLHANGHHMAVAYEAIDAAIARIAAAGEGEPIARRRLTPLAG